jgi:hypothetical protein
MPSRLTVVFVSLLLATPAVIFWLWLVVLPARVAILCPEGCRCDSGEYYVHCSDSSLRNIPLIFPKDIRELLLFDNSITSLENDSFISRRLTELVYLGVSRCGLETIELGAFNGLAKLIGLSMSFNQISEILPRTFENMSSLVILDLAFNRLQYLEVDVFCGLNNVENIQLEGNELQHLHPDMFVGLPNLENLGLAVNPDLQIPTDSQFISSNSLTYLGISLCSISSVSVEALSNISALEQLDMSYNNLSSVDINILKVLPKLSTLYLYGNPLQCDCQLQEVWRWCQDHSIKTANGKRAPECNTPSEVQGIWWGVLERSQCLQDDIHYYGDYENTSYRYTPSKKSDTVWDSFTKTDTDFDQIYFDRLNFLKHVQAPVYAVPFIFGTTGNVIILIIIICNKDMRTVPNMYFLNLAISDMIYLMVHFAESCANTISYKWLQGEITCKFFPFCRRLSVGLSAYSVAVYSIQRYRVTVNPFHVRVSSQQMCRVTMATICGVWIVAAVFALPSILSWHLCQELFFNSITYYQNVVIFELLVSCVLPLCVIAFSYIMTARHLMKSAQPIFKETQIPQLNKRKNTAKIVVGLTVVFLISYVPYHVLWTYIISKETGYSAETIPQKEYYLQYTYLALTCLLLINPCFNPVALFCTSLAFRRQFNRYLICRCKANSPLTNLELTTRN